MTNCLACLTGMHFECMFSKKKCCCNTITPSVAGSLEAALTAPAPPLGGRKTDADIYDAKSTGRKRAAKLYPLRGEDGKSLDLDCEWSGLKLAGGGRYPIVGCIGRKAKNRHHGPDKSTLNNAEGNVHRICPFCHNRWHTRNDPLYDELRFTEEWLQHNSILKATPQEIAENEAYWAINPTRRYIDREEDDESDTGDTT